MTNSAKAPSFTKAIEDVYYELAEAHLLSKSKVSFDIVRKRMADKMQAGHSARRIEEQSFFHFLDGSRSLCIERALAYCYEAEQAFEQGGIEQAWPALIRAHYFVGLLGRESEPSVETRELRVNSGKGGAGKAKKYQPLKDKIISLLETKRPTKGWRNSTVAIKIIFPDLEIFNNEVRLSTNLASLLSRWSKEKTPFGDAFREAVQKRS